MISVRRGVSIRRVLTFQLPEMPVSLLWHASYDSDPAHRWLRQTVIRLAAETTMDA